MQLPDYEAQPLDHYSNSLVKDGLAISIRPLTDKQEVKKYFGADLLSANIIPVFVLAENRNSSSSFILSKDRISLKTSQSGYGSSPGKEKIGSESTAEALGVAGVVLGSLLLGVIAAKFKSDAGAIRRNATIKELQTKTISPGKSIHGFTYFELPNNNGSSSKLTMHIEVLELKKNATINYVFSFEWKEGRNNEEE